MSSAAKNIWKNDQTSRTPENSETAYHPGAKAPRSGLYWVNHLRHRLAHLVYIDENSVFPHCRRCGTGVRFTMQQRVQHLEADRDFSRRAKLLPMDARKGK